LLHQDPQDSDPGMDYADVTVSGGCPLYDLVGEIAEAAFDVCR
jgi:hypothetical protein